MNITSQLADAAIAQILGGRIERYRIESGLTQAELAEQAGVGKRTVERIEAGHGAELLTLIRILRALNVVEGLERLLPELPPSPIEQLKLRGRQRRRVSRRRSRSETPASPSQVMESAPAKPWTWGTPDAEGILPAKGLRHTKRKS
jgi:transcriptional regulator with XRE-family HTH domain